jgi:DNA-binding MarR family transcriptional regulator
MQKSKCSAEGRLSMALPELSAGDEWIQRWLTGLRWRRRAERALKPLKLTFAQWRALDAIARLIGESGDAVSQIQVARRIQMDKTTLCRVLQCLGRRGLVDQAPACPGTANRIFLTEVGENLARHGRAKVDAVSGFC